MPDLTHPGECQPREGERGGKISPSGTLSQAKGRNSWVPLSGCGASWCLVSSALSKPSLRSWHVSQAGRKREATASPKAGVIPAGRARGTQRAQLGAQLAPPDSGNPPLCTREIFSDLKACSNRDFVWHGEAAGAAWLDPAPDGHC